ncbi:MAG: hypothetical protein AAFV74_07390 [Pseudomonadota bacterium]
MLSKEVFLKQFEGRFGQFLHLQRCIDGLIKDAFNREGVPHLYVQSRVKSADSAFQKVERKKYESPFEEMTDIVAVRIIVYLNSEVELAKQKITALFEVDDFKSTDKRQPRAADVVGYRSLHMICSLGLNRAMLDEYAGICEIPFEVQIRTVLEHAWAEIEHKQNYKSKIALPSDLQRRLMVVAGALELADRELSNIADDAIEYADLVSANSTETEDDWLSETSLGALVSDFASKSSIPMAVQSSGNTDLERLIEELNSFGIKRIGEARGLLGKQRERLVSVKETEPNTIYGLIRNAMILEDYPKYFNKAYQGDFFFRFEEVEALANVLGIRAQEFRTYLKNSGVEVFVD